MRNKVVCCLGTLSLLATLTGSALAQETAPATPAPAIEPITPAPSALLEQPAVYTLASQIVLRLRSTAGGLTPQQRVDILTGRVANLLGIPGILPSDVVVYAPKGGSPAIYALGRRMITVDAATVKAAGGGKALDLAKQWAGRLQQTLPRANYRPPNAPEPKIPLHPSLLVTSDFTKVGGAIGQANLHGKPVIFLYGPQAGGLTAQERADQISMRLDRLAGKVAAVTPDPVRVETVATKNATLLLGDTPVITVGPADARAAGAGSAQLLATVWARNIRRTLNIPDPNALPTPVSPPAGAS